MSTPAPINGPTTIETSTIEEEHDNITLESPYWDGIFNKSVKPIEWLLSWSSSSTFFIPFLSKDTSSLTLAIGTGNSNFPIELHKQGYCPNLIASDFSTTVIDTMQRQLSTSTTSSTSSSTTSITTGLSFEVQDARKMTYKDASVDTVIDKSLLDCMYWAENRTEAITPMVQEIHRVLKQNGTALFMTQRDPTEVLPFFSSVDWESVEYIPIAAQTDANGDVVPGCSTCLEDIFDDYYDESEFYELIFIYICTKPNTKPNTKSNQDKTIEKTLEIVPCRDTVMKLFEAMAPTNSTGLLKRTRSFDDDEEDEGQDPTRKKRRVAEGENNEKEDSEEEDTPTSCPNMCQFADSIPDLVKWGNAFNLKESLDKNNGIVIIDNFLPTNCATELRNLLKQSNPSVWELNADDGDADDTPHQFLSCASHPDPGFSAATRTLWSLMTNHLPSFSAARYNTSDHIALHDDTLIVPDGNGGELYRDVAVVLYMVDDEWDSKKDGGVLLDHGPTSKKFQTPNAIVPKFNRLVCFNVPRFHEVTPVLDRSSGDDEVEDRPRLSIFGWFLTEDKLY